MHMLLAAGQMVLAQKVFSPAEYLHGRATQSNHEQDSMSEEDVEPSAVAYTRP
jgi:hypothetical protein